MADENEIAIPNLLSEFFEILIHSILFKRSLYGKSVFIRTKAYGIAVYQAIHPEINEYIAESLKGVQYYLKENTLKALEICLKLEDKVLERYIVNVVRLNNHLSGDLFSSLEQAYRTLYLKIQSSMDYLDPLPEEATFILKAYVHNYSWLQFVDNSSYSHFPWIPVPVLPEKSEILPVHTVETDELKLQVFIEKLAGFTIR